MAQNSGIEWTDHTFNPWIGCTRVSPACDHCYAAVSTPSRAMAISWGAGEPRHRTADGTWNQPKTWNGRHDAFYALHGRRQRVFCASLADVFDNEVDPDWRRDLFRLIDATPNLDWLLLTKRIGNVRAMCDDEFMSRIIATRVWLGATVVNQAEADRDIPKLLYTRAHKHFLSMEPLLGPVDIRPHLPGSLASYIDGDVYPVLDWVIVGGESGRFARPMHPEWVRSLRNQCAGAGVPFLFKQWGEWKPISEMPEEEWGTLYRSRVIAKAHEDQRDVDECFGRKCSVPTIAINYGGGTGVLDGYRVMSGYGGMKMFKVGKKAAGREIDGRVHDAFPVAEFASMEGQEA
ncbi:phage Gp37/Gp68 family protein [Paraburkholderia sediminicola]|uniref:phage Gp37/Gp68 family protein n=1 Tax=Paraburkholderia sediminicola TaxID=458836 RepID=UPI0038B8FB7A